MHLRLLAGLIALIALAAAPSGASAASLLNTTVTAPAAAPRACHERVATGAGVVQRRVTMPVRGIVSARLTAADGDWDVSIFDVATGRNAAGSAGFGSTELASGYVGKGRELIVQACRRRGDARTAKIGVTSVEVPLGTAEQKPSLAKVFVANHSQKSMLGELGFDLTEHAGHDYVEVVLYGEKDRQRLRDMGFRYDIVVDDMVRADARSAAVTRAYTARQAGPAMPSGRTDYRHLVDYEADMKKLVEANPGLVKPIVMRHKTLEGRTVNGIEITQNVNRDGDGKPIFVQLGIHHAREWPSGEHAMEWAFDIVNRYGKDDQVTDLVNRVRTIVVPIVNVDGFNVTREAPVDSVNNPLFEQIPDSQGANAVAQSGTYLTDPASNYRRRNCRLAPSQPSSPPGACALPQFRVQGVDPNRNYGGLWGGPGASALPEYDTYRGQGPFSEPESENVRDLVSKRQVAVLITNHTFSNLVLRPPGVRAQGEPVDEAAMRDLGARMAEKNGYINQHGYDLYDTTGTTEDWTYLTAGGFGYTFEIGPKDARPEDGGGFHPAYPFTIKQYAEGQNGGGGNRAAYLLAMQSAADISSHARLTGKAPKDATLRVRREVITETSPVEAAQTDAPVAADNAPSPQGERIRFKDTLESTLDVPDDETFSWAVNPSTRPVVDGKRFPGVADTPTREDKIANSKATQPGDDEDITFTVTPEDNAKLLQVTLEPTVPTDDYDITLFFKEGEKLTEVDSSGNAPGSSEEILVPDPKVGEYLLRVNNFLAFGPWTGQVRRLAPGPDTLVPRSATEALTFTCEAGGTVIASQKIVIERGQAMEVKEPCGPNAAEVVAAAIAGAKAKKPACATSAGFRTAGLNVLAKGKRVRFSFARRVPSPVTIEVFQASKGRTVLPNRRIARFTKLKRSFTWNGRSNGGKAISDGVMFVRYRVKGARTRTDFRRFTLERRKGVFRTRRSFYRPDSCGLLASAKLEQPVFGGTKAKPLKIAYRLLFAGNVTVRVTKGKKTIRTFRRTNAPARKTLRLSLATRGLAKGDYTVRIAARSGKRSGAATLVSKKL